uniref:Reverse transcriptase Ty1/copia-type domain-containing protein n=1 Tax=Peronospora matthiolae TaxID=2874970 RepID=A0AAV1TT82_9STRA
MKEKVFCAIPEGVEVDEDFDCSELVKAIYGLKQASRVWNETFHEFVCSTGFPVSDFDPCLYLKITSGDSTELIMRTKSDLKARFEMTDSGKCAFVLGIELVDHDNGSVTMCRRRYVEDVLKRFGMSDCKAVTSPTDISSRLIPSTAATTIDTPFREAVGASMHLMTATRPDIAFAIDFCGDSDADWADDRANRKSTSGYAFILISAPVSWGSKRQSSVSLSTSEAEHVALSLAI